MVKSHGATDYIGFYHSIDVCYKIIKGDLPAKIKNNLSHIHVEKNNTVDKYSLVKIISQQLGLCEKLILLLLIV